MTRKREKVFEYFFSLTEHRLVKPIDQHEVQTIIDMPNTKGSFDYIIFDCFIQYLDYKLLFVSDSNKQCSEESSEKHAEPVSVVEPTTETKLIPCPHCILSFSQPHIFNQHQLYCQKINSNQKPKNPGTEVLLICSTDQLSKTVPNNDKNLTKVHEENSPDSTIQKATSVALSKAEPKTGINTKFFTFHNHIKT
jgi:hypothetical protein